MKTCPTCQAGYPTNFAVCPQDGTPLVEVGAWSPGAVVRGKYRILSKIGQGGMGSVYKALHVTFDELRAIKVISPELIHDQLFLKRFKHEAVITRKLQHPNAVRVDDIDEAEDGRPFIVMEFIEGQSLRRLIEEHGAMPVERASLITKQAAAALEAAHRLGMVHRDIKPDNIVLVQTPEGEQAKVLDFGIAKIKEGGRGDMGGMTLTGTGVVIGTPQYMSPEQAMGRRGDQLDGRSDLYSLGIVMYQMLTGDLPFRADTTMEMLLAHMQQPAPNVRAVRPELHIPDAIAQVVMRLLEKKPDNRPRSARALIEEIEAAERAAGGVGETQVLTPMDIHEQPVHLPPPPVAPLPRSMSRQSGATTAPTSPPFEPSRPVAPPRPADSRPAAVVPPPRDAPQVTRAKKPSQAGIWAALGILVIGLAGGVWYFTEHQAGVEPPGQNSVPESTGGAGTLPPLDSPAGTEPASTQPPATTRSETPAQPEAPKPRVTDEEAASTRRSRPAARQAESSPPSKRTPQAFVEPPTRPTVKEVAPQPRPEAPPAKPALDPARIRAARSMAQFYLDRGDYDKAIREYQQILALDPTNQEMKDRITRARNAKAAEALVNQ